RASRRRAFLPRALHALNVWLGSLPKASRPGSTAASTIDRSAVTLAGPRRERADEAASEGSPAEARGPRTTWTFALTSIALFMAVLDNLVVVFALPTIRADLHATVQQLEWTINAFTLTFAVLLLTGAALGDRFGRRRVFAFGIAVFTLASMVCALAPNIETLLVARAVQGFGGAIIMP